MLHRKSKGVFVTTIRALPYIIILLLTYSSSADAAKCSFTAANINFGTYNIIQTSPNTTTGTISVTCHPAKLQPVTIALSTGSSGNYAQRELSPSLAGVDRLRYNIFTDASYSTIFGNGTGGSQILLNTVSRTAPWNVTYYGRIPADQDVSADLYTDILTMSVDF